MRKDSSHVVAQILQFYLDFQTRYAAPTCDSYSDVQPWYMVTIAMDLGAARRINKRGGSRRAALCGSGCLLVNFRNDNYTTACMRACLTIPRGT